MRRTLLKFVLAWGLVLPALAQTYLAPDVIDARALVPAPPADDSPAGRADLETVLQVQADRSPAQVERARRVAGHTLFLMGAAAFGPEFNAENMPQTAGIYRRIREQSRAPILGAKKEWSRARPYARDERVQPCVDRPGNTSYPSGHSAESAIWAEVLAEAFPDHREVFLGQVRETMWCRVLGGAHFPSDTQAGRHLGEAIGREMLKSPDMQRDLQVIRAEAARLGLVQAG